MNARRYQTRTAKDAAKKLAKSRTATIIAPVRSGKTRMVFMTMERAGARPALVMTPLAEISLQWAETAATWGWTSSVIAGGKYDASGFVVATTNASAAIHIERILSDRPDIHYLVMDEAHHASSPTMRHVQDVFERLRPKGKIVFVTATIGRSDGQEIEEFMDSYPVVTHANEALLANALKHWKTVKLSHPGRFDRLQFDAIFKVWEGEGGRTKCSVWFMDKVDDAVLSARWLQEKGVAAECLSGSTPKKKRAQILADYDSGRITTLVNCRLLTEGIDINQTELVVLASQPATQTPLIQKAGRALGNYKGKGSPIVVVVNETRKTDLKSQRPINAETIARNSGFVPGWLLDMSVGNRVADALIQKEAKRGRSNNKR